MRMFTTLRLDDERTVQFKFGFDECGYHEVGEDLRKIYPDLEDGIYEGIFHDFSDCWVIVKDGKAHVVEIDSGVPQVEELEALFDLQYSG